MPRSELSNVLFDQFCVCVRDLENAEFIPQPLLGAKISHMVPATANTENSREKGSREEIKQNNRQEMREKEQF